MTLNNILQSTVKAVNDTVKPNSFILILFVFGTYLRITEISLSSLNVYERAEAIRRNSPVT